MASLSAADLDLDGAQKRNDEKERARNAAEDAQRKAEIESARLKEKLMAQAESLAASCEPEQTGTSEQPPSQSQPEQKQKRRPGRPRSKPKAGTAKGADRQSTAGLQAPTLTEKPPGQAPLHANRGSAGVPARPPAAAPSRSQPPGAASPLQLAQASTQQRRRSQTQRPSASAAWRNSELHRSGAAALQTSASDAAQLPAQPAAEPAQQPAGQPEGRPASQLTVKSASKRLKVQLQCPSQSASQPAGPAAAPLESRQPAASVSDAAGDATVALRAADAAASSPAADTLPISAASSPLRTALPDVLPLSHSPTRVPDSGAASQPAAVSRVKSSAAKGGKRQPWRSPASRTHLLAGQQLEDSGSPEQAASGSPKDVAAAQQPQQFIACLGATPEVVQPQGGAAAIRKRHLAPSPATPPAAGQAVPEPPIPKQDSPPAVLSADSPEGTASAVSAKAEGRTPGAGLATAAVTVVPAELNSSEARNGGMLGAQLAKGKQSPQRSVPLQDPPGKASPAAAAAGGNASLPKEEPPNPGTASPPAPSTSTAAAAGASPGKPLRNGSAAGRTPVLAGKRKLRKRAASPDAQPAAKAPRLPPVTPASKQPAKVCVTTP